MAYRQVAWSTNKKIRIVCPLIGSCPQLNTEERNGKVEMFLSTKEYSQFMLEKTRKCGISIGTDISTARAKETKKEYGANKNWISPSVKVIVRLPFQDAATIRSRTSIRRLWRFLKT